MISKPQQQNRRTFQVCGQQQWRVLRKLVLPPRNFQSDETRVTLRRPARHRGIYLTHLASTQRVNALSKNFIQVPQVVAEELCRTVPSMPLRITNHKYDLLLLFKKIIFRFGIYEFSLKNFLSIQNPSTVRTLRLPVP